MVRAEFAFNRWHDQSVADEFYHDYGTCLTPEDIARAIVYVLEQIRPRRHLPTRGDAE